MPPAPGERLPVHAETYGGLPGQVLQRVVGWIMETSLEVQQVQFTAARGLWSLPGFPGTQFNSVWWRHRGFLPVQGFSVCGALLRESSRLLPEQSSTACGGADFIQTLSL